MFDVNKHLVQAAAERSEKLRKSPEVNYRELVQRLSKIECDEFLVDLAEGKPGTVLALHKRLSTFFPEKESMPHEKPRSVQQLENRASQIEEAEEMRLAEEARQRHIAEMEAL